MPDLMQILTGFGSVAVIITIGWLVGRAGVLGKSGGYALNMVVYWVAMPCMLLHTLATSDTGAALGAAFAVAAGSALTVAAIYMLIARPLVGQRGRSASWARCRRATTTSPIWASPSLRPCCTMRRRSCRR